jgi:hypothetical protein
MKQQFVVTHQHKILETAKTWPILNRPTIKHVMFLLKYKDKQFFCGHNILSVFVTQLSSNAGISVWRIVWITTNCHFMSDMYEVHFVLGNSGPPGNRRDLVAEGVIPTECYKLVAPYSMDN